MNLKPIALSLSALFATTTLAASQADMIADSNSYRTFACMEGKHWSSELGSCVDQGKAKPMARPAAKPAPIAEARPAPQAQAPAQDGWISSYLYVPTGMRNTSGLMVERLIPSEVVAGQPFEYKIKATNLTPASLKDVRVEDLCSENFKLLGSTPEAAKVEGNLLQWDLGELAAGESRTIAVRGATTDAASARSCMSANYDLASCQAFNVVQPRLDLKVSAPAEVLRCEPIPIRYTVGNPGTGAVKQAALNLSLPKGTSMQGGRDGDVTSLGDLAAGATRTVETVVTADALGSYEFKPVAVGKPELRSEATATTRVTQPVLEVAKSGKEAILLGRDVTYEIKVTNTGDAVARDVVVNELLPAGAPVKSASDGGRVDGGNLVWNLAPLAPKESRTVSYTLAPGSLGTLQSSTRVRAYCADQVTTSAKTDVAGIPAVLLEVIDLTDPIEVGENTTYVITATNQGSATDINLRIAVGLEDTMSLVSASGTTSASGTGPTIQFAPLPRLEPGDKAVWNVTVKAVKPGDVRFHVKMLSDLRDRSVDETEATTIYK